MRLLCFDQAKTVCRYGCMYFLVVPVLVCVDVNKYYYIIIIYRCDGDVIYVGHDLNRCSGWWYQCLQCKCW